jgi:hypothetical protein
MLYLRRATLNATSTWILAALLSFNFNTVFECVAFTNDTILAELSRDFGALRTVAAVARD